MENENNPPPSRKMKTATLAWSIGLAVIVIFFLMSTSMFFGSTKSARPISKEKAIYNNLRQIAAAGQQYILEEDAPQVTYEQLVGEWFAPMQDVSGETYTSLIVHDGGGELSVTTEDGLVVTFVY